ncbi:hypothetical protein V6Z11_A03G159200 [Gossypium hirsutum]
MEPHSFKKVIIGLIFSMTLLPSSSSSSAPCNFPAIFNFGDSNSDTGGLSAAFGQAPAPNGETYFHAPAAESFGLPYLSAYLDSVGLNFSHGANFATAGSTIRRQNTTIFQSGASPISLDVQLVQFSEFHTRSKIISKQGVFHKLLPKEDYFSKALYTFDIGQNDLTAGYKLNLTTEQIKAYVPDVLLQLSEAVKRLYDQGGRTFWIHNTGPVGCLPYVLDRFLTSATQLDKYGCGSPFNEVAQYFNQRLKDVVIQLRKQLPLAAITYVDVYSVKYTLISQAKKLGFELPLIACCGHGGKYNFNNSLRCGGKITVKGKEILIAKSCGNPSVRVNWDGIHFTEAANRWIFQQIASGSFSDPPLPLKMAYQLECRATLQIPENPNYGGSSYNNPTLGSHLQIHPEVIISTEAYVREMTNNGEDSNQNVEDFSDLDVDELSDNIDDEGPKEVEDVHGSSFSNPNIYTKR